MAPFARLDADYITQCEYRARRFSGAYTGTSGTLAADVMRLLRERASMTAAFDQLAADNQALREAVAARMDATPEDDPKKVGYSPMAASLAGCKPAQEAAARCFDTTTEEEEIDPTDIDDPGEAAIPVDWILRGERELKAERESASTPVMPMGFGVMSNGESDGTPAERLLLDALDAVRDRRGKYGPPINHFSITVRLVNACFGTSFTESDWATIMVLDKIARSRGPMDCRDNDVDLAGYAACRAECRRP